MLVKKDNVYREKRMPKGWKFIGDNSLSQSGETYISELKRHSGWYKTGFEARAYNRQLIVDIEKRKRDKKAKAAEEAAEKSNAETLVEKKYRKDKN